MLSRFSIVVTIDNKGGISLQGKVPWDKPQIVDFQRKLTTGNRKNAVIMGRMTYELFGEPPPNRHTIVISSKLKQERHPNISIFSTLLDALIYLGGTTNKYDDVFICGGETLFQEVIRKYMYLCNKIYVTKLKTNYECDLFFPLDKILTYDYAQNPITNTEYIRYIYDPKVYHTEYNYLDLLEKLMVIGEQKGLTTLSLFGRCLLTFDLNDCTPYYLPFITTKKLQVDQILDEIIQILRNNSSELEKLIKHLKSEGDTRFSSQDLLEGYFFFSLSGTKREFDCSLSETSTDFFSNSPINIAKACLIFYIIGHLANIIPRKFSYQVSELTMLNKHKDHISRQVKRTPRPFPTFEFRNPSRLQSIHDFTVDSFIINEYIPAPPFS